MLQSVKSKFASYGVVSFAPALLVAGAALLVDSGSVQALTVQNGFDGYYNPDNWTLSENGGDGSVNTAEAPGSISITGSDRDEGSEISVNTDYTIAAAASGSINFSWAFTTTDIVLTADGFGYLIGPNFVELTNMPGSGSISINVTAGETFGFRVFSTDDKGDPGIAMISSFSALVPDPVEQVPAPLPLLGVGAVFFWSRRLRRRLSDRPSSSPYRLG